MNLLVDGLEEKTVFKTELTKQLSIDNHTEVYPVYKIRLDKLYYNDQNDRIATWISQYKADNKINSIDMKNKEEYNNIIHQFITESNPKALSKTQKNIALVGQEQPGVVLADGRIVDGNRRFTCLRNIQEETGNTQYMNAVILERDITGNAKEIKMLELYLQHGVDKPVDYDPIDRLVGIYNDIVDKKLLSITEYAKSVNLSEREIKREVDKAKLMVEFLEFIDAPKQFHLARKLNINDPWDNACIESFHSLIKREWLNRFKIRDYGHAYRLVFEYLEAFYNTKRILCVIPAAKIRRLNAFEVY